jgi:hypothetical protein
VRAPIAARIDEARPPPPHPLQTVEFSRILLGDIVAIKKGVYIIAPKEAFAEENHWGLVISYLNEEKRCVLLSLSLALPSRPGIPRARGGIHA